MHYSVWKKGTVLPVDVEFTVEIVPDYPYPKYKLHVVQCRPLSQREDEDGVIIPANIRRRMIFFSAHTSLFLTVKQKAFDISFLSIRKLIEKPICAPNMILVAR